MAPLYRYVLAWFPTYPSTPEVISNSCYQFNRSASDLFEGVESGAVLFEGKLGCSRRGRHNFENQSGERRIIILEPGGAAQEPSPATVEFHHQLSGDEMALTPRKIQSGVRSTVKIVTANPTFLKNSFINPSF